MRAPPGAQPQPVTSPAAPEPPVVAIVPAHLEEATVARTVTELLALPGVGEVLVVADGCTDGTGAAAHAAGARVLASPSRRGKGEAVEAALDRVHGEVVLLVDADVGETARGVSVLLREVLDGRTDAAVGVLPPLPGGGLGMVKRLAGTAIRALAGRAVRAPLSGQRAVRRAALEACRPLAGGFGLETAMTIDLVRLGYRVLEVDVDMRHRATGRTLRGFLHRGRQGADILRAVVPRALRLR